jgi:hypothetical protein
VKGKGITGGAIKQERAARKGIAGEAEPVASLKAVGALKQERATRKGIAGDAEPVASFKCQKLAVGDKADAGKGKRIAKVSQKYIDILLKEKATGTGMYSKSKSRAMEFIENNKHCAHLAPFVAGLNAIKEEVRAGDAKILDQYHSQGYAFGEVEEESFIYDEEICGPLARSRPPSLPT